MHVRCHAVSHPSHRIIPVLEYAPQAEQASVDKYSWRVMLIMFISCSMHLPSSTGSVDIASKVDDYSICLQELAFILYELYCI